MAKTPSSSHPKNIARSAEPRPAENAVVRTEIEREIEKQIAPLVPGNAREQVLSRVFAIVRQEEFKGPLPHPRHFQEYEAVCPGAADRILSIAENTRRDQREINDKILDYASKDQKLGMWLGFFALVLLIVSAVICGLNGHDVLAGAFLTAGAFGLVGKFIVGRNSKDED